MPHTELTNTADSPQGHVGSSESLSVSSQGSPRIVAQFSCGAASAVATRLALARYGATHDVQILNAFLLEEHEDNRRFAADCSAWFGRPITVLRDERDGASVVRVFKRKQYMMGPMGAQASRSINQLAGSARRERKAA